MTHPEAAATAAPTTTVTPPTVSPTAGTDVEAIETFTAYLSDGKAELAANETDRSHSRRKREILVTADHLTNNNAYTMEVLVAVDRRMQEYHGHNIKPYILTLLAMVSRIYADASIGNSINVAVVHILMLNDDLHVEQSSNGSFECHPLIGLKA